MSARKRPAKRPATSKTGKGKARPTKPVASRSKGNVTRHVTPPAKAKRASEREARALARKRSEAAKRAAETRARNKRARELAEARERRKRSAAAKKAAETRARNKAQRAADEALQKERTKKRERAQKQRERRFRKRQEEERAAAEYERAEREAITFEEVAPPFVEEVPLLTIADKVEKFPKARRALEEARLRAIAADALKRADAIAAERAPVYTQKELIRNQLANTATENIDAVIERIASGETELADDGDFEARELYTLFYSPDAA